ncbi:2-hydroxychromene-2-carboxylate isomerase [Coralloluteibacterium thermophilus]|uniref:2-hydroxychromene-2-carboxylate isomerase n=1 Tax=Coralloluteibacterium thermophilum TaxID=2707049 RepID=A0ABV9NJ21_9GAMM
MPTTPVAWYFDFVSPFAYLQWPKVRALMAREPVTLRPILFAGVLDHLGLTGPAEIPAKRLFTYRIAQWRAGREGVPLRFPPAHPFNPLAALRLCIAAGTTPDAVDALFDWIWRDGNAGDSIEALAPVAQRLGIDDPAAAIADPAVKAQLKANYEAALAAQVFGVPTLTVGGDAFWGSDAAHELAEAVIADPGVLETPEMRRLRDLPVGARRRG